MWIPRFRLKTLLATCLVAGAFCGWVGKHLRLSQVETHVLDSLGTSKQLDYYQPPTPNALVVFC